jgi:hypothetical protein
MTTPGIGPETDWAKSFKLSETASDGLNNVFNGATGNVGNVFTKVNVNGQGAYLPLLKQTEIDFGVVPVAEASFVITDAGVSTGSRLVGNVAYEVPTGKDLDELEMDGLDLKFAPGAGQFTLYARGMEGYVADKFKINYLIG